MSATASSPATKVVLAVDDEAVSLTLLAYFLKKAGYQTVTVDSAEAARQYIARHGPAAVDCVVTDYRMPGETGLELLLWLKQQDRALSVIMITATTEREFVAETLRGGAIDFLDKPIAESALLLSVRRAIEATLHSRHLAETERAISQVGKTQHQLFGLGAEAARWMDVCFHPQHQAGGDFVNFFQLDPASFLVLTADVSGHDLHAAFVSAYFQGMMRGMLEAGQPLETVLAKFNRFLIEEWGVRQNDSGIPAVSSVSVCTVLVRLTTGQVSLSNHGFPQPWQIGPDGRLSRCETLTSHPLGWFSDLPVHPHQQAYARGSQYLLWTDGLEDLALGLKVSPLALASALQRAQALGRTAPEIALAKDDVLVVHLNLAQDSAWEECWQPVLLENYPGSQSPPIDAMQNFWERCLQLAVPDLPETRRFDVMLALRESVINALLHGCRGNPQLQGQLALTHQPGLRTLRAIISDPGTGHAFTRKLHEAGDELADLHRGLSLINRLATQMTSHRHGAELILDFRY